MQYGDSTILHIISAHRDKCTWNLHHPSPFPLPASPLMTTSLFSIVQSLFFVCLFFSLFNQQHYLSRHFGAFLFVGWLKQVKQITFLSPTYRSISWQSWRVLPGTYKSMSVGCGRTGWENICVLSRMCVCMVLVLLVVVVQQESLSSVGPWNDGGFSSRRGWGAKKTDASSGSQLRTNSTGAQAYWVSLNS